VTQWLDRMALGGQQRYQAAAVPGSNAASGVASSGYRWYLASQVLSIVGTMMSYTALFWLALHIGYGGAAALAAVDAAQCLPMLLFSRRAGIIVTRHRAVRMAMMTQGLQAAGALAIGFPLLAGWMTIWYLVPLCFVIGCVQCVDLPARQTLMLDLVGPGELRRGSSLFATVTGLVVGALALAARTRAALRIEATADAATAAHRPGLPLFEAVVQATEEAVVNALVGNQDMIGRDGHRTPRKVTDLPTRART
jgi:Transmembrane secretion effector